MHNIIEQVTKATLGAKLSQLMVVCAHVQKFPQMNISTQHPKVKVIHNVSQAGRLLVNE